MIQTLDVISVNIWQIVISLANLLLIFLILKKLLWKPIQNVMKQRQEMVDKQFADAAEAQAKANEDKALWEEKLATADEEAHERIQRADEAARRHGVASALLEVYCRFAAVNLAFLTLEVRKSNAAAIGLYEKFGFQQAGLRKGYYQHPREDALIMTRTFDNHEAE